MVFHTMYRGGEKSKYSCNYFVLSKVRATLVKNIGQMVPIQTIQNNLAIKMSFRFCNMCPWCLYHGPDK